MRPSVALASDVMIKVTGKPPGIFGIPGFELALAVIAIVTACAIRRTFKR